MFWDVQRKWGAKNRFAGENVSPGHFFSLRPAGALNELKAYGVSKSDYKDYALLRFTVSIDNILDLTDPTALRWFYKKHFADEEDWHWAVILDAFLEQQLGGDAHNDFAGQQAILDGYNGIAFFGARSLGYNWPAPGSFQFANGGSLGFRDLDLVHFYHETLRDDPKCINIVIFFGHNVVRATRNISSKISVSEDGKVSVKDYLVENQLFDASYLEIDAVFQADPTRPADADLTYENLRHRAERTIWPSKPGIRYQLWKPKGD